MARPPAAGAAPPLASTLCLAAALRLWGLGARSLWYDELFAIHHSRLDLRTTADVLTGAAFDDLHPPLYYLLAQVSAAALGASEWAARALSAAAGVAAVALAYALGRELRRPSLGAWAALLLAVDPFAVYYAREARMYALLACLSLASSLALARLWRTPASRLALAAWAALSSALALTHDFGALALAAQLALALAARPPRAHLARWCAAFALPAAALAPWLPVVAWQSRHGPTGHLGASPDAWRDALLWIGGSHPRLPWCTALPLLALAAYGALRDAPSPVEDIPAPSAPRRAWMVPLAVGLGWTALAVATRPRVSAWAAGFRASVGQTPSLAAREGEVVATAVTLAGLAWLLASGALAALQRETPAREGVAVARSPRWVALSSIALPLAVTAAVEASGRPLLVPRSLIALAPMVTLLAAAGVDALRGRARWMVGSAVALAMLSVSAATVPFPWWRAQSRSWATHTHAEWRALREAVPRDPALPVAVLQGYSTDAVLHYLSDRDVLRLTADGDLARVGQAQHGGGGARRWRPGEAFDAPSFYWVDPWAPGRRLVSARAALSAVIRRGARCAAVTELPPDATVYRCEARRP